MKSMILAGVIGLTFLGATDGAQAAGCVSGAAVGGIAGHMAGHHGLLGAAAGCVVGHHEANKQKAANMAKTPSTANAPNDGGNAPNTSK